MQPKASDSRGSQAAPPGDSDSSLSIAATTLHGECNPIGKDSSMRTTKQRATAVEARGELTLKASADHRNSTRVTCSVQHGVLTMSIEKTAARASSDARTSESSIAEVAKVPVAELAVRLQPGLAFTIATVHKNREYDKIYCQADDQVTRDEWEAVFRQTGAYVVDLTAPPRHSQQLERLFPGRLPLDDKNVLARRYQGVWGKCGTREASCRLGKSLTF
jgi:hypothetical protein